MINPVNLLRDSIKSGMKSLAKFLDTVSGGRITPTMITLTGLFAHIVIAWLIVQDKYVFGALALIVFGLFDALDGALARYQKVDSPKGMLLDSITDRLKEPLIYTALAYSLVHNNNPYIAIWAIPACSVSILISYINAWGEVVTKSDTSHTTNKAFRGGFLPFEIRISLIIISLLFNIVPGMLVVITVLGAATAALRMQSIMQRL